MPNQFEPFSPSRPLATQLIRELWQLERSSRITIAALYQHPAGIELRVTLEPWTSRERVLHRRVEQFNFAALREDASVLLNKLLREGWREIAGEQ